MSNEVRLPQSLKESFVSRAVSLNELEAVVDLLNAYWEPLLGVRKITVQDAQRQMTMPGFDIETSTRVVQAPDGQLIGCIVVADLASPPVHPNAIGCVHPDYERRGIGTYLITWAEQRARKAIARVPDGARVTMYLNTAINHAPTRRLFEKLGLTAIRYSWFMVTDLNHAPPEPQWPGNVLLCTYQDHPDLRAVYRTVDDAFRDHWGHVERPEEEGLERWRHRIETDADFDPSLWLLAMDGDEIAGVALCQPKIGEDTEMGVVDVLGVRRPWRRQGLALALLHQAFGEFHRRGKKRAGLGVDADSLTGATRLYEKAGMHMARQLALYEKELRPGEELGRQSI